MQRQWRFEILQTLTVGPMLDTLKDVKRRKAIVINVMHTMNQIWKSSISENTKIRIFNSYIEPVFLSNSELWTTTSSIEGMIDSFQRRLLWWAINIRYPRKICTEKLKLKLKYIPWSNYISTQRLRWLGHDLHLPEDSPARQARYLIQEPVTRTGGRSKTKWIDIIKKQLKELDTELERAKEKSLW